MEIEPRGLLWAALPLLRRRMRRDLARDIAIIKARLEGPAEGRPPGSGPFTHGSEAALRAVKAIHTLAWFSIEACMVYVLYAGFARRSDRRAGIAAAVVAAESLIFAGNGFRCPLTQVAERLDMGLYPQVSNGWTGMELNPGAVTRSGRHFGDGKTALADPRVREAIALAVSRKELVTKIWDGLAVAAAGYLPPAYPQWAWNPPAGSALNYDPARANQILNAAGYKMGPGGVRIDPKTHRPLVFRFGIDSDQITDAEMAPYLAEWPQAIGIKRAHR